MADVSEMTNDVEPAIADTPDAAGGETPEAPANQRALCARITETIRADKKYFSDDFKRMKRDMFVAMHGREEDWSDKNYKANIAGRHVKQKTASLYAKNPKASAKRAERLDFAVWDEDPQSLLLAFQTIQQGILAAQVYEQQAALPTAADPMAGSDPVQEPPGALAGQNAGLMGHNGGPPLEMPPGFAQAQAVIQDFQQGMERRKLLDKVGKTLEILFTRALREPKPTTFKTGMKQLVRRTSTTGVGYIELGFQREYGPRPGLTEQIADARTRLDHLRRLAEEMQEGEIDQEDAEAAELEASLADLQQAEEILIREGLVFDYPRSTKVIPDKLTKTLVGFVGARHLTIEYEYTVGETEELFPGVDLKKCANYSPDGKKVSDIAGDFFDEDGDAAPTHKPQEGLIRVWKHYDKPSGLVYYVADGHPEFLRPPAAPDIFVEDFWPVYAITFNEVESEDRLFPPSDVELLLDMQREFNRARQGAREHREARRPRWMYPNGALEEDDIVKITQTKAFQAVGLNVGADTDMSKVLQQFPVPGVDPNLYETGQLFGDMQLVVGTQQANLGGLAKATATESAISANSTASADESSNDDLDALLTTITRAAGQILLREMSEEQVMKIVGPGAAWPHMSLADIADELYLDVEAGSSGKPNQAVEMNNWKTMLPFLIQMGSIRPEWLARETLRRLDDKMDLTDAVAAGIPAIVAANRMQQPTPADPGNAPDQQGAKGGDNTPKPAEQQAGTGPAFGSNQV